MSLRPTWLAVLVLAFASCSKPAKELVEAGNLALGRSDYDSALANFGDALDKLDAKSREWTEAKWGAIQALVYVDAPRARREFLELAKSHADSVTLKDYQKLANELSRTQHFDDAIDVVAAATERFPESRAVLDEMTASIEREAKNAADPNVRKKLDELRKIPYLGEGVK